MEKGWEKFRDIVMECTNYVCGMRRVSGREERGVNGGMKEWVGGRRKEKRFEEWLQRRFRVTYDRCETQKLVVKRAVKVAKRMADW